MTSLTEQIATGIINKTLLKSEWTHHAHLQAGLWHVLHYEVDEALMLMRQRIRAYNESTGVINSANSGYHETITRFYLIVIRNLVQTAPADTSIDELARQVIERIGAREFPFEYYSRDLLFSEQARAVWIEPDLKLLLNIHF